MRAPPRVQTGRGFLVLAPAWVGGWRNDYLPDMDWDWPLVLSIVAIVLAIAVPLTIERLRRPHLRIEAHEWRNDNAPWQFAAVYVYNDPLTGLRGHFLTRREARP